MVDPNDDSTYKEIKLFELTRNLVADWLHFLMTPLQGVEGRMENIPDEWYILNDILTKLPVGSDLLKKTREVPYQYFYHESYMSSDQDCTRLLYNHNHTRITILSNFSKLIGKMSEYKMGLTKALPPSSIDEHEKRYAKVIASFRTWSTMAESRIKVPFSAIRRREQSSRRLLSLLSLLRSGHEQ